LIDKKKINALIRYSYTEIEYHINALENVVKFRVYGLDNMDYLKPYKKLLKDIKKIRDDLLEKYNNAMEDNNKLVNDIEEKYDRDMEC